MKRIMTKIFSALLSCFMMLQVTTDGFAMRSFNRLSFADSLGSDSGSIGSSDIELEAEKLEKGIASISTSTKGNIDKRNSSAETERIAASGPVQGSAVLVDIEPEKRRLEKEGAGSIGFLTMDGIDKRNSSAETERVAASGPVQESVILVDIEPEKRRLEKEGAESVGASSTMIGADKKNSYAETGEFSSDSGSIGSTDIELEDMKNIEERESVDALKSATSIDRKKRRDGFKRTGDVLLQVQETEEAFRKTYNERMIDLEAQLGEKEAQVDSLQMKNEELERILEENECGCLRSIDNGCQKRCCVKTHFAHTCNKSCCKGAALGGIVSLGIFIGCAVCYFLK